MRVKIEVCFWGSGRVLPGREACGSLIKGFVLSWVVVTQVYILIQIHWAVHLRLACFTLYMMYFNEKVKGVWKRDRGGIWNNIWVVIPRVPKPMGKSSLYLLHHTLVLGAPFSASGAQRKRAIQQCRCHGLKTRAPSPCCCWGCFFLCILCGPFPVESKQGTAAWWCYYCWM